MLKYSRDFNIIVVISSIFGIFFAIRNNNFPKEQSNKYSLQKNNTELINQTKENKNLKKGKKENLKKKYKEMIERAKRTNIHKFTEDGKIIISCAYALDNAYAYPTLVAMISLVENAGKKTFYHIYIMFGSGFNYKYKRVLSTVEKNHKDKCKIIFINMEDKFKNADINNKITTSTYYRLALPNLLPDVNRIIWMDGDTAVFEDLTELITIDMKNNYIMGFLDSLPDALEIFGIKNATVLCAGVLLLDLDALRKNNMEEKMNKFINDNLGNIYQHDQTVINVVCQNNIAPLPPKFGMWGFEVKKFALEHNERQKPWLKYDHEEFVKAFHHPAIVHYIWPKPFWQKLKLKIVSHNKWWNYASISGFYDYICNKSPKLKSNKKIKNKYFSFKDGNDVPYVAFFAIFGLLLKNIKKETILDISESYIDVSIDN